MIDGLIAWGLLIWGVIQGDPLWAIASGLFAIAAYIGRREET